MLRSRLFLLVICAGTLTAQTPLPGTAPLTAQGDLAMQMVDAINADLLEKTAQSPAHRRNSRPRAVAEDHRRGRRPVAGECAGVPFDHGDARAGRHGAGIQSLRSALAGVRRRDRRRIAAPARLAADRARGGVARSGFHARDARRNSRAAAGGEWLPGAGADADRPARRLVRAIRRSTR